MFHPTIFVHSSPNLFKSFITHLTPFIPDEITFDLGDGAVSTMKIQIHFENSLISPQTSSPLYSPYVYIHVFTCVDKSGFIKTELSEIKRFVAQNSSKFTLPLLLYLYDPQIIKAKTFSSPSIIVTQIQGDYPKIHLLQIKNNGQAKKDDAEATWNAIALAIGDSIAHRLQFLKTNIPSSEGSLEGIQNFVQLMLLYENLASFEPSFATGEMIISLSERYSKCFNSFFSEKSFFYPFRIASDSNLSDLEPTVVQGKPAEYDLLFFTIMHMIDCKNSQGQQDQAINAAWSFLLMINDRAITLKLSDSYEYHLWLTECIRSIAQVCTSFPFPLQISTVTASCFEMLIRELSLLHQEVLSRPEPTSDPLMITSKEKKSTVQEAEEIFSNLIESVAETKAYKEEMKCALKVLIKTYHNASLRRSLSIAMLRYSNLFLKSRNNTLSLFETSPVPKSKLISNFNISSLEAPVLLTDDTFIQDMKGVLNNKKEKTLSSTEDLMIDSESSPSQGNSKSAMKDKVKAKLNNLQFGKKNSSSSNSQLSPKHSRNTSTSSADGYEISANENPLNSTGKPKSEKIETAEQYRTAAVMNLTSRGFGYLISLVGEKSLIGLPLDSRLTAVCMIATNYMHINPQKSLKFLSQMLTELEMPKMKIRCSLPFFLRPKTSNRKIVATEDCLIDFEVITPLKGGFSANSIQVSMKSQKASVLLHCDNPVLENGAILQFCGSFPRKGGYYPEYALISSRKGNAIVNVPFPPTTVLVSVQDKPAAITISLDVPQIMLPDKWQHVLVRVNILRHVPKLTIVVSGCKYGFASLIPNFKDEETSEKSQKAIEPEGKCLTYSNLSEGAYGIILPLKPLSSGIMTISASIMGKKVLSETIALKVSSFLDLKVLYWSKTKVAQLTAVIHENTDLKIQTVDFMDDNGRHLPSKSIGVPFNIKQTKVSALFILQQNPTSANVWIEQKGIKPFPVRMGIDFVEKENIQQESQVTFTPIVPISFTF